MIEYTGNLIVHHPDLEDRAAVLRHHANQVNQLVADQNNPEGDER